MTDQLKATYSDLEDAATAMTTAASSIQSALSALKGKATLDADAFSDKGAKFASWYSQNLSSANSALTESHHSFGVLADGLRHAAAVYLLADVLEANNAKNHGNGGGS